MTLVLPTPASQWTDSASAAPTVVRTVFFLDSAGDWDAAITLSEAAGHTLGFLFRDVDGDVAIDTSVPVGGTPLRSAHYIGEYIYYD